MADRGSWRRLIERPVPWQTAVVTVLAFSLILIAVADGQYVAAVLVLVAAVGLDLAGQAVYNRRPGRTARLQDSTLLPYSPETVWALIMPPEKAPLVDANIRRGYREAGSPDGVGERHVLEALDGQTTTLEVIELEPARRAVVRLISPAPKRDVRVSYALQPMEKGCLYSMGFETDLLRGQYLTQRFKDAWHSDIQAMFGRMRQVLVDAESDRGAVVVREAPVVADDESPPEATLPGE
jgi:hypothetical protein